MVIEIKSGKAFLEQEYRADVQLSLIANADKIKSKLKYLKMRLEWKT
jgi:hypothetical protein